ncbi:hypothetical protein U1Q18_039129 [Sarracenia purpurea var. burkii]
MLKMDWITLLFSIFFLARLIGASQESVQNLTLHDPSPKLFEAFSHTGGVPWAIPVGNEQLNEVSSSVLAAESWVRTHVLAHYPAAKITAIVVGHTVLCSRNHKHQMGFILSSLKNVYHSLTRWGLEREIKVSTSFSTSCLNLSSSSATYRDDLAEKCIKPILKFLQDTNSPYLVNPPRHFFASPGDILSLVSSHGEAMKNIGVFDLNKIKLLISSEKETKPLSRKLSFMDSKTDEPFPERPPPLSPTRSPIGYSVPAFVANTPFPPLVGTSSPPPLSLPFAPEPPPIFGRGSPPSYGPNLPPCNPSNTGAPTPAPLQGAKNELWCVAKPSVPAETLQEAMDYACGEGGADCEAIKPQGSCYFPDSIVAHASYAFNSYWQKNKGNGGTCGFGGTSMLINADPSAAISEKTSPISGDRCNPGVRSVAGAGENHGLVRRKEEDGLVRRKAKITVWFDAFFRTVA